jgi:hypothetical protein
MENMSHLKPSEDVTSSETIESSKEENYTGRRFCGRLRDY